MGKVEVFWEKPPGEGPFPALLIIHGHQGHKKTGAEHIAKRSYFPEILKKGFVAIAVSQSGYGATEGQPDNCGETSQEAVKTALRFARKQKFIDGSKIAIAGQSMGASLAALIAAQDEKLAGVILSNGIYDQENALIKLFHYSHTNKNMGLLHEELQRESGTDTDRFLIRSAINYADKIKVPVLILAGLGDLIAPAENSLRLHEKIQQAGGQSRLVIFPFSGHNIDPVLSGPEIKNFLSQNLRN